SSAADDGAWAQADRLAAHRRESSRLGLVDIGNRRGGAKGGATRIVARPFRAPARRRAPGPGPFKLGAAAPAREPTAQLARRTPATARPDGSAIVAKLASQAIAAGEEQAIDLPPGTVSAAAGVGKWRSNRLRYR